MGKKANGDNLGNSNNEYFCQTFADIVSTKTVNCSGTPSKNSPLNECKGDIITAVSHTACDLTKATITTAQQKLDSFYKSASAVQKITLVDGISVYQASVMDFGTYGNNYFSNNGVDVAYAIICIDISGASAKEKEDPFGYGVRVDGKILPGARATEWLKKDFHKSK